MIIGHSSSQSDYAAARDSAAARRMDFRQKSGSPAVKQRNEDLRREFAILAKNRRR